MAKVAKRRGRYVLDFYDHKGKRHWKTMPKGTTKKQALNELREISDQLLKGIYVPATKIPLFSKVAKDWLDYKKPNVRKSTWRKYEGYTKNHFDELKNIKINRISTVKVEKFIIKRQNENMNLSTLRKLIVTLNQIMKYAVRHGYIAHNPVTDAERPKDGCEVDITNDEDSIRILAPAEINSLLDAVKDPKYCTLFRLAIASGAREGELFGLKWTDVDWFNGQIHIRRTFNENAWYKPKSKTSVRNIDIGPATMAALRQWKLACPPNELDLIFPNGKGNPLNHGNMLRRHFYPALKNAKLPHIRFHDLRHTYASLLIAQGENIKYIQNQLGHASPSVCALNEID
jgi:integrase